MPSSNNKRWLWNWPITWQWNIFWHDKKRIKNNERTFVLRHHRLVTGSLNTSQGSLWYRTSLWEKIINYSILFSYWERGPEPARGPPSTRRDERRPCTAQRRWPLDWIWKYRANITSARSVYHRTGRSRQGRMEEENQYKNKASASKK